VCEIDASGNEDEIVNVLGRHRPFRSELALEWRKLVALDVELGGRAETVGMDRVSGVAEIVQVCERRLDVRAGVAPLDLYEYRGPQSAQRRLAAAKHGEFMPLYVALDEVDALEWEVVKSTSIDLKGLVGPRRRSETCEAVGGSIADYWDVQRRNARLVRECEWMELDILARACDREQRPGMLTIRLEGMDETGGADDACEEGCVGSPARTDVEDYITGPQEFFCYARCEVSPDPLSPEIEARAEPRRSESREANDGAERIDASHSKPAHLGIPPARAQQLSTWLRGLPATSCLPALGTIGRCGPRPRERYEKPSDGEPG
jgi:hypothetical protein